MILIRLALAKTILIVIIVIKYKINWKKGFYIGNDNMRGYGKENCTMKKEKVTKIWSQGKSNVFSFLPFPENGKIRELSKAKILNSKGKLDICQCSDLYFWLTFHHLGSTCLFIRFISCLIQRRKLSQLSNWLNSKLYISFYLVVWLALVILLL